VNDAQFLVALEACTLPEVEFGHRGHVRAGYLYLRRAQFTEALCSVRAAIRNCAIHHGQAHRYDDAMTVAYLTLIQQHLLERGDAGGWLAFADANPELFVQLSKKELRP